ncbi:MAG TPA: ferrous iron transport protein A [Methanomassiliicoccales archaeon]|nr:ferrous iron transport protein A [Methanomassiliicoccales archaeon]
MNAEEKMKQMSLADPPVGRTVYVTSIKGSGPIRGRILAMGLVPGTAVEVVRRAPMGDPLEVRVKGYSLSLRAQEAMLVMVSSGPSVRTGNDAKDVGGA